MAPNTLQIYLKDISFDRPALAVVWGDVATFIRNDVDGDYQMYLSPASFRIVYINRPGAPDVVHRYEMLLATGLTGSSYVDHRFTT